VNECVYRGTCFEVGPMLT